MAAASASDMESKEALGFVNNPRMVGLAVDQRA
jgi:hypothetical protein